jgi:hypothetical protein
MKYFKGDAVPTLDSNLIILAEDSKAKATILFNDNIDLTCYTTEDYKRLKKFLVPWYASLRSFSSTMANATDIRSLPEDHLNELISSFGYVDSLSELTKPNKINFFYDLINLYKIKGTPESIERVLSFFGIIDVDVMEYWLQYDDNYDLIFKPTMVSNYSTQSSEVLNFDHITNNDPHWRLSKDQINNLFLNNKIAFPSKTPYFGLKPTVQLSGSIENSGLAILSKIIQDMYTGYLSGIIPDKDLYFGGFSASLLELYLGFIYGFNLLYPKTADSSDSLLFYDNSNLIDYDDIILLYDTITSRTNLNTRDEIKTNQNLLNSYFTRLKTNNFLTDLDTAGNILEVLNPDLKKYLTFTEITILNNLLKLLSSWIKKNINEEFSNLPTIVFGFSFYEDVIKAINFFKPYRARLISIEHNFIIDNPLQDTVIADDFIEFVETENFVDFDTANSIPGYENDITVKKYYSRNNYDTGSYFDIGAAIDKNEDQLLITQDNNIFQNYHIGDSTFDFNYATDSTGEVIYAFVDSGWSDFDSGMVFDGCMLSDNVSIYLMEIP